MAGWLAGWLRLRLKLALVQLQHQWIEDDRAELGVSSEDMGEKLCMGLYYNHIGAYQTSITSYRAGVWRLSHSLCSHIRV